MSVWVTPLISGFTGIAGVVAGSVLQARIVREQERQKRLYEPAADLSAKLRGAATSVDYLVRPLVGESSSEVEEDAYERAKHLIEEASARRAGTELAFPADSRVYESATAAVAKLRTAFEAASRTPKSGADERTIAELSAARSAYEDAIQDFTATAREEIGASRRLSRRSSTGGRDAVRARSRSSASPE